MFCTGQAVHLMPYLYVLYWSSSTFSQASKCTCKPDSQFNVKPDSQPNSQLKLPAHLYIRPLSPFYAYLQLT